MFAGSLEGSALDGKENIEQLSKVATRMNRRATVQENVKSRLLRSTTYNNFHLYELAAQIYCGQNIKLLSISSS